MTYTMARAGAGDTLFFGRYPQGGNGEVQPIAWQVLEVRHDRLLVQARYILDAQPYDTGEIGETQDTPLREPVFLNWEACTLRAWLNGAFLDAAFTSEEREQIWFDDSTPDPHAGMLWALVGAETKTASMPDRVFLLGLADIHAYYPGESAAGLFCPGAAAACTPYAAQKLQEPCWWLRTPMRGRLMAHIVSPVDSIGASAMDGDNRQGVRPAMWLNRYPSSILVCDEGVTEIDRGQAWGTDYEICVLPASATKIASSAFEDRRKLRCIAFSENLEEIGEMAFEECTALRSVLIPDRSRFIDEWEQVDALLIPEGVKLIDNFAFMGCTGLTTVVIPGSVTSIGYHAFMCCSGLTAVEIGEGVRSIGWWAFGECTGLTTLVIPDSVTEIGENAFAGVEHIIYNGPAHSDDNWGAESWSRT